jgi:hypothetical protein
MQNRWSRITHARNVQQNPGRRWRIACDLYGTADLAVWNLYLPERYLSPLALLKAHAFRDGGEGHMRDVDIAGDLERIAPQDAFADDLAKYTAAEFFNDAGTVIAACLGLSLLMQILLG